METYKNKVEESYGFLLQDFGDKPHDYFLHTIKPDSAISYLHGQLLKKDQVKAEIFLSIEKNMEAYSLSESPFGGFWTKDNLSSEAISYFIDRLVGALAERGVIAFSITQAPKEYCLQSDLISYLLFTANFKLEKVLSHQVFCGKKKLKGFSDLLVNKYAKKIKFFGFTITTSKIQNFGFLQDISQWNQSRGYKSTITEDKLVKQVSSFPERYQLISIYQNGKAIGHTLAVKLTSDSLYYFLSGINPKMQHSLTGELMMTYLIKFAADQKVCFLDFGTSDLGNEPNHNLMFFKSKYANEYSNKLTWKIQVK